MIYSKWSGGWGKRDVFLHTWPNLSAIFTKFWSLWFILWKHLKLKSSTWESTWVYEGNFKKRLVIFSFKISWLQPWSWNDFQIHDWFTLLVYEEHHEILFLPFFIKADLIYFISRSCYIFIITNEIMGNNKSENFF